LTVIGDVGEVEGADKHERCRLLIGQDGFTFPSYGYDHRNIWKMTALGAISGARPYLAGLFCVTLYAGSAAAFECAGLSLPSNIVICSDPELMRLADER
jgi:hypothetical protein